MNPQRQLQYRRVTRPIDADPPGAASFPELQERVAPPLARARSVALLAPCIFFVNFDQAPADTGEWRFQQPLQAKRPARIVHAQDSAPPIEAGDFPGLEREQPVAQILRAKPAPLQELYSAPPIEAGDFPGLELEQAAVLPGKARQPIRPTIFYPPEMPLAPFDALEWYYHQPWRPQRKPPAQASTIFGPIADTGPVFVHSSEWTFRMAQLPRLRQRGPSSIVIQPIDVQVVVEGLEWQFKAPQARGKRPAQKSAIYGPSLDGPELTEWIFKIQSPGRRKLPARSATVQPIEVVPPSPDSLEWRFKAPPVWRRVLATALYPYYFAPREPWETIQFKLGAKAWEAVSEAYSWEAKVELSTWEADSEVGTWETTDSA